MKHWESVVVVLVLCVALTPQQAHSQAFTCTAVGRYANPTDTTCKNYVLCVFVASNSTFVSYNYVCPTTSLFNPNTGQCTSPNNYTCPGTAATANNCAAQGFIADPNVSDCSSYIQCVDLGNGVFSQTTLTCPATTFYNPTTTLCDSAYVCPTANAFTCAAAGRFSNPADTACQSYFFCVLSAAGSFLQYNYTCPTTSLFSPTAGLCTTNYTCVNAG